MVGWFRRKWLNGADAFGVDTIHVNGSQLLLVGIGIKPLGRRAQDDDSYSRWAFDGVRWRIGPDLGHRVVVEGEVGLGDNGLSARLGSPDIAHLGDRILDMADG